MKSIYYLLVTMLFFSISSYSQNFSDIVNLDYNSRAKNVVKGTSNSLLMTLTPPDTIKEIVIISMDPGTGCNLPSWFNGLFSYDLLHYFNESTLNNYIYSPIVIRRDATHAFELESVPSGHDHGATNIDSVLFKADSIVNFAEYDWNNDRIVEVHFTSIGPGNWGVVGNVHNYTSRDSVIVAGVKRPIIVRVDHQSRGVNRDNYYGVIVHENGHYYFDLIDQDHSGLTTFNHWGSGSFDVMSDVLGFYDASGYLQPSPYSPVYSDVTIRGNKWLTAIPITSSNQNFVLSDYQSTKSLYVYTPSSLPSNAVPNEKFYISYIKPTASYAFSCFPLTDKNKGGVIIWHVKGDGLIGSGDFWNWYSKDFDIEAALGKTNWSDDQYDSGISNPISGRDKLEVRKVVGGAIVGGPYTGEGVYSAGEEGILYIPGDGKKFNFYSNPNSNWYNQYETYAHNILSGFSFKNLRYENGQAKVDININHYTVEENTTLTVGKWYINNTITVNSGVTLTIQPGTELYFGNGASLVVNGTLNAQGSSENRITFTS
ncbi:hypothetical protein ACSSWA_14825, partial [Melioribacter sp. Ez-97]